MSPLFAPHRMGGLDLPNRIIMAPLTSMRTGSSDHVPTALQAEYGGQFEGRARILFEVVEAILEEVEPSKLGVKIGPMHETGPFAANNETLPICPIFRGTLIANVDMTAERGNRLVADGVADLVAFGRPYIANPDLVERLATGAPPAKIDWDTVYASGRRGYADYPANQHSMA